MYVKVLFFPIFSPIGNHISRFYVNYTIWPCEITTFIWSVSRPGNALLTKTDSINRCLDIRLADYTALLSSNLAKDVMPTKCWNSVGSLLVVNGATCKFLSGLKSQHKEIDDNPTLENVHWHWHWTYSVVWKQCRCVNKGSMKNCFSVDNL